MSDFLPYGRQTIDDDDVAAVVAALQDDLLTTGPQVERFEAGLKKATGAEHAVVCNSGTAALHLAALALGLKATHQAIVPAVTFVATANAPGYTGAEIIFADVDPETGLMTPETFLEALERAPRAKAAFPVHLAGRLCDMAALKEIADARGVALVEDACHALGTTTPGGGRAGDCAESALACFSFHPVKTIAMGEGGAVTTNDAALADAARRLRSHGLERDAAKFSPESADWALGPDGAPNPWVYEMAAPGWNYRAPDILCALGSSQLKKLSSFVSRRRALAALYDKRLERLAPIVSPNARTPNDTARKGAAWHIYAARIDFEAAGISRAEAMAKLKKRGVGSQVHYAPVHLQPYYRRRAPDLSLPGALSYYERTLSLPLYPTMEDDDVDIVVDALAAVLRLDNRGKR